MFEGSQSTNSPATGSGVIRPHIHTMAYIDNTDTKKEMNDAMRGNAVSNVAPTKIIDSVQPVININPKDYRRVNIVKSSTSTSIYTTPLDKDFFLVGWFLNATNKTASQDTSVTITAFPKGETSSVVLSACNFSTSAIKDVAESNIGLMLPNPILIERNTAIAVARTNAATTRATIFGYTVEP